MDAEEVVEAEPGVRGVWRALLIPLTGAQQEATGWDDWLGSAVVDRLSMKTGRLYYHDQVGGCVASGSKWTMRKQMAIFLNPHKCTANVYGETVKDRTLRRKYVQSSSVGIEQVAVVEGIGGFPWRSVEWSRVPERWWLGEGPYSVDDRSTEPRWRTKACRVFRG